jgi:hypothetical protein
MFYLLLVLLAVLSVVLILPYQLKGRSVDLINAQIIGTERRLFPLNDCPN